MKKLILFLLIIIAIEFNLQFNWVNYENEPNWVKAWDEHGREVELISEQERVDGVWYWNIYDSEGNLITFLNFWIQQ